MSDEEGGAHVEGGAGERDAAGSPGGDEETGRDDVEAAGFQAGEQGAELGEAPFDAGDSEAAGDDAGDLRGFAGDVGLVDEEGEGGLDGVADADDAGLAGPVEGVLAPGWCLEEGRQEDDGDEAGGDGAEGEGASEEARFTEAFAEAGPDGGTSLGWGGGHDGGLVVWAGLRMRGAGEVRGQDGAGQAGGAGGCSGSAAGGGVVSRSSEVEWFPMDSA